MATKFDISQYEDAEPPKSKQKFDISQYEDQNPSQGWGSVLGDIKNSVSNLAPTLGSSISQLIPQAFYAGKQVLTNTPRSAENLGYGLLNGIQGATEIPANIAEYLKSKGIGKGKAEDWIINNTMRGNSLTDALKSHLGSTQSGDEFLQSLGGFAPVSKVGALSEGLGGVLKRAGAGGLYSATQNQDPLTGALINMAMEAPGKAIGSTVSAVANPTNTLAKLLRGNLSVGELEKNLEITKGTNTPLGRVIQDPLANTLFETLTSKALGSGKMLGNIKEQVKNSANDVLESLKPEGAEGDLNNLTHSLLQNAAETQRQQKNALYGERERIANEEGHVLKMPNTEAYAKKVSDSIEKSPFYISDPEFKQQYNRLMPYKNLTKEVPEVRSSFYDKNGNLTNPYGGEVTQAAKSIAPSLTDAQVIASDWSKKGNELASSKDAKNKVLGNNLINLSKSIRQDVEQSIASGSPELQAAHAKANENYAKNYSPFLDESINDKINEKDPQTMVRDIINPGKEADKYSDIQKVINLLPEEQKKILAYAHLKKAQDPYGNVDPKELAKRISSLGPRQLQALIPDDALRQKVTDFGKLRGMNEKALNNMVNPETGISGATMAQLAWAMANPVSAIPAFIGAHGANRLLTSESLRESLVNKMIENSQNQYNTPAPSQVSTILTQALSQAAKNRGY